MKKNQTGAPAFTNRILELRRQRGWSQPELGKKIGTSGAIIGRYERGEISPSIEVARKLADVLEVTTDYLISGSDLPEILKDREMINRWQDLQQLSENDRAHVLSAIDGFIRNAKTRKTYNAS